MQISWNSNDVPWPCHSSACNREENFALKLYCPLAISGYWLHQFAEGIACESPPQVCKLDVGIATNLARAVKLDNYSLFCVRSHSKVWGSQLGAFGPPTELGGLSVSPWVQALTDSSPKISSTRSIPCHAQVWCSCLGIWTCALRKPNIHFGSQEFIWS